jgi:ankyrin repeat protein
VLFANVPQEIGEQLMNHSSGTKALTMTNAYGATPMHISVAHTQISFDAIELLATPDSVVAQDSLGRNALHIAAQNVHISAQVIKFLVETNPLACNKESDGGYLPMHLAVHSKAAIEVVQELYESYPSSLERDIILGDLPLHRAATNNAPINVIKFLLKEFIGAIYKQNQLGNLPLHCAVSSGASQEVIKELVQVSYCISFSWNISFFICFAYYFNSASIGLARIGDNSE